MKAVVGRLLLPRGLVSQVAASSLDVRLYLSVMPRDVEASDSCTGYLLVFLGDPSFSFVLGRMQCIRMHTHWSVADQDELLLWCGSRPAQRNVTSGPSANLPRVPLGLG